MAEIDLARYITVKLSFFKKHHYETGDVLPVIPYAVLVKRDVSGNPVECHLRGYKAVLPQHICWLVLAGAEKYGVVPLLKGVYDDGQVIVKGLPESLDEAITLLEDLPFPPRYGAVQALYTPYTKKLDERAELWLLGGATVLADDLNKYYTVIVSLQTEKWRNAVDYVAEKWPDVDRQKVLSLLRPIGERVNTLVTRRTVGILVASRSPEIAVLPLP